MGLAAILMKFIGTYQFIIKLKINYFIVRNKFKKFNNK
jgi:hypothetical protein